MRPKSVVLLFQNGKLLRYELFFNRAKAERAFRRAEKAEKEGMAFLEKEGGDY
jgi:hypothetical protein